MFLISILCFALSVILLCVGSIAGLGFLESHYNDQLDSTLLIVTFICLALGLVSLAVPAYGFVHFIYFVLLA